MQKPGSPRISGLCLLTPERRKELMKEGWKSVGKIFILAVILDVVYQLKFIRRFTRGSCLSWRSPWRSRRTWCCAARLIESCGCSVHEIIKMQISPRWPMLVDVRDKRTKQTEIAWR